MKKPTAKTRSSAPKADTKAKKAKSRPRAAAPSVKVARPVTTRARAR